MIKMNDEQRGLFDKLTPLQREISLNSISGMNDIDAYKNSKGKAKTEKAMSVSVAQILGNLSVKAFIDSMADSRVNPAIMSRDEMLESLTVIARGNLSDIITWEEQEAEVEGEVTKQSVWTFKDSSQLTKEKMSTISEVTSGVSGWYRIKQHSPLSAMKQLAELAGYEAPKQLEVVSKEELTPWDSMSVGVATGSDD